MSGRGHTLNMSEEDFTSDLQLIVELEDEINRATDWQREQQWVKDRISNLRYLYQHLEQVWWPISPGRGGPIEE